MGVEINARPSAHTMLKSQGVGLICKKARSVSANLHCMAVPPEKFFAEVFFLGELFRERSNLKFSMMCN